MSKSFPIGFHIGPGGNASGLKTDFMAPLDSSGIQFFIKAVDTYPKEAVDIAGASGLAHTIVWRKSGPGFDVPDYSKTPQQAASEHMTRLWANLPPEIDLEKVWIEPINEVDKNRADWLGQFGVAVADFAFARGMKVALFAFSSGEPEPEHWEAPGMLQFLRLAAQNKSRLAVALHEYSYSVDDILRWYPWLIGRFKFLHDACDNNNIDRPTILITEWGWEATNVPDPAKAVADIDTVAQLYVEHPNILGAGLWYLGPDFGGIANKAQKLIKPTGDLALGWTHYVETEPPPETGDCIDLNQYTKYHMLRPRELSAAQWDYVKKVMTSGVDIPGIGNVILGYEGWSHVDALLAIRTAVSAGMTNSRLVVVDGHQIGTGLDRSWMDANCPGLVPYTVWLNSDGTPVDGGEFAFTSWPTDYKVITQKFGVNPQNYLPYGLPGHEGVDIRAPSGTPVYSVANGSVSYINSDPSRSNYGNYIKVAYSGGYSVLYAHLQSIAPGISVGTPVTSGQLIGLADNTGNSFGSHLHITLYKEGGLYTDENGTTWPYSIFDPTPYLAELCPACFGQQPPASGLARLGLHASADGGLASGEVAMFQSARVELVKILSGMPGDHVGQLANALPGVPFVIRAYLSWGGRNVTPQQFFDWTISDVKRAAGYLGGRDVIVELHNEPNLEPEGLWHSWNNGAEFASWLARLAGLYRAAMPGVKLAFPGLSPGGDVGGLRIDNQRFMRDAAGAIPAVDYLGVHTYWAANWPMSMAIDVVDWYLGNVPTIPVIVTEASNNKATTSQENKASEYVAFHSNMKSRPRVYGVTYFVASASNPAWGWSGGSGEVWLGTSIPSIVGGR